ncbi:hypothetical protein M0804_007475 [Polistes exclamans]|nr:hypothetical protein M0804_007475 [Polistes exclamans]
MYKFVVFLLVVCVASTLAYPADEVGVKEDVKLERYDRAAEPAEPAQPAGPKAAELGHSHAGQELHHGGSHPPPHHVQ